jgi:FKBP-type peptidyl-prolyl cis-trans isomerase FklB
MKKIVIMTAGALMLLGSCSGGGKPNANLKTDVDSLSYEVGYLNSRGVKEYISQQLGVDTAYIDEFIKGVKAGAQSGEDKKKAAYNAGIQIGQQISTQMFKGINYEIYGEDSTKHVSLKNMVAGFIAGVRGKAVMDYKTAFNEANRLSNTLKETTLMKSFGPNKKAGEDFIAKMKATAGVKELPGGTLYKVIKEGNGPIPTSTSRVQVSYEGRLVDGKVFDSSYKNNNGKPVEINVNQVIPGWTSALTHMPVGSVWELYIPQDQAYGTRDVGQIIKPFSALVFKLELVSIQPTDK